MAKIELGDIFELDTAKGRAYFQCVKIDKLKWDTLKVFNKLYDERPLSTESIIKVGDHYFIGFALSAAFKRKLVVKIGNIPLSNDFELPQYRRIKHIVREEVLGWFIVDITTWKRQFVEVLSLEQKKLSPWGVWNDTLLKEKLESGWNLESWD
jgi:hypothetical protein